MKYIKEYIDFNDFDDIDNYDEYYDKFFKYNDKAFEGDKYYVLLLDYEHFDNLMDYIKDNNLDIEWVGGDKFISTKNIDYNPFCLFRNKNTGRLQFSSLNYCKLNVNKDRILDPFNLF